MVNRFVGYLEEEAVITYTDIISLLDSGKLPMWKALPAPQMAVEYYRLGPQATMRYSTSYRIYLFTLYTYCSCFPRYYS
jgi:hypothetical protein